MRNLRVIIFLSAFTLPLFAATSALELMLEGRFGEARQMIAQSKLSPRYELLYYAITEADAARACSLYQVVAIRYPQSDCDTVARQRLDQARTMGFAVIPIAEWAQAPAEATPLFSQNVVVTLPTTPPTPAIEAPVAAQIAPPPVTPPLEVKTEAAPAPAPIMAGMGEETETPAATPVPVVADQPAPADTHPVAVTEAPVVTPEPEAKPEPAEPPVAVASEEPAAPPEAAHASSGKWYVQVGAFANADNAHRLTASLEKAGYAVKIVPLEGKKTLLQVRVGGFATKAELAQVKAQLKEKFNLPTAVVAE